MEFHRLRQMIIEAGFKAAADIFLHSEAAERDSLHGLTTLRLSHQLVTAGVRKTNVADDDVETFRLHELERALPTICRGNFVPALAEEPGKNAARIGVIVHQK